MITAALLALVVNYSLLRVRDDTVRVAVVAEDIRAGAPVTPATFRFADVRLDPDLLETLLVPEAVPGLDGFIAVSGLEAGDLVRRSDLQPPSAPREQRAMSVPITPEHAVAGALTAGDRVDIIEVREGTAAYLVTDAQVLAVAEPGGLGAGIGGAGGFSVTVAVDDVTALRLASAMRDASLEIVRSTGAEPVSVSDVSDADRGAD